MTLTLALRVVTGGLLVVVLFALLRYAPWDATSYLAWTGVLIAVLGAASVAMPMRWLGIGSRGVGLAVLAGGALLAGAAILWPTTVTRDARPGRRLDHFMAEYQSREYHEARTRAPIDRVEEAVREVSFAEMPVAVLLLRLRALAGGDRESSAAARRPILDLVTTPGSGFLALDTSNPRELVYGMAGQPWRAAPPPARPHTGRLPRVRAAGPHPCGVRHARRRRGQRRRLRLDRDEGPGQRCRCQAHVRALLAHHLPRQRDHQAGVARRHRRPRRARALSLALARLRLGIVRASARLSPVGSSATLMSSAAYEPRTCGGSLSLLVHKGGIAVAPDGGRSRCGRRRISSVAAAAGEPPIVGRHRTQATCRLSLPELSSFWCESRFSWPP